MDIVEPQDSYEKYYYPELSEEELLLISENTALRKELTLLEAECEWLAHHLAKSGCIGTLPIPKTQEARKNRWRKYAREKITNKEEVE